MIKCFSFGKSLKQLFIIGLISCFTLLVGSSVNATEYSKGLSATVPGGGTFTLQDYGNFLTDYEYKYFITNENTFYYAVSWIDNKLYVIDSDYNNPNNILNQGFISEFGICPINQGLCSPVFSSLSSDEFYTSSVYNNPDSIYIDYLYSNVSFCFGYDLLDKKVCAYFSPYITDYFTGNLGISSVPLPENFVGSQLSSYVGNSPFSSSGGNGSGNDFITIELTGDDYINYFEKNPNYNFDRNICYVGTNDLTTTGISGIPYYEGTGKNIVQLFAHLYGNTFTTKDLSTFLNTWNINYGTWYLYGNRDELDNPLYNAYYSLNSGFHLDYSDKLTNPFLTNPTAIYFMASTISDYGNRSTLGEEIATYCYYKLKKENSDVFTGINITDNHDSSIDNNAGTFKDNWNRYSYNQSGINVVSESWSDSDLDYFSGSDFVDFGTFFHESMQKLKTNFNVSDFDLGLGVLPGYIIFFLLTLVLFRFLSH